MAEAHRTRDHSLWFNAGNFRENPGEGILASLTALVDGQAVSLLLNGVRTQWARFANGSQALRAADSIARQAWDAIPVGTWATVIIAPPVGNASPSAPGPIVAAPPAHQPAGTPAATPVPMRGAPGPGLRARLFDAYIFIDWSATNSRATGPGQDQLWLGELQAGNQPSDAWFASRSDCSRHVEERLLHHVAAGRRVLVRFDFAYGYPAGFADGAGLPSPAGKWRAVWTALSALLRNDDENRSNRFEVASALNAMLTPAGAAVAPGPFWNTRSPGPMLTANSPVFPFATRGGATLPAWRLSERMLGRFIRDLPENSQRNAELRLEKLTGRPITAPLMMVQAHDADGGLITHDSLFGELRHVTAFAAGSCAAQTLKLGLGTAGGIQFAIAEISHAI